MGLTITRDELENELAGRPALNQRHRMMYIKRKSYVLFPLFPAEDDF